MDDNEFITNYPAVTGETITSKWKAGYLHSDSTMRRRITSFSKFDGNPEKAIAEVVKSFDVLSKEIDPIQLLSMAALQFINRGAGSFEFFENIPLLSSHLEMVQGLILGNAENNYSRDWLSEPPSPRDIFTKLESKPLSPLVQGEQALLLARDLSLAVLSKCREGHSADEDGANLQDSINNMRAFASSVRNWAYPARTLEYLLAFTKPLDDVFLRTGGFKASSVVLLIDRISRRLVDKAEHFFCVIDSIRAAPSGYRVLKAANKLIDKSELGNLDLNAKLDAEGLKRLKRIIIHNCWQIFANSQVLSFDELHAMLEDPIQLDLLKTIINTWSLNLGDLSPRPAAQLILDNPVWDKPLIAINGGVYVATPTQLYGCVWNLIEGIFVSVSGGKTAYHERRSSFLEEQVERSVRRAFPSGRVYAGNKWFDENEKKEFENDLMVILDDFVLVIECKAGQTHDSAWRGGEKRLKSTIQRLLIEPSVQSARLLDYIEDAPQLVSFQTAHGGTNLVEFPQSPKVIRLTITLDSIANVFSTGDLVRAGLVGSSDRIAPAMTLPEFDSVLEIIQTEAQRMHYFSMRNRFESEAQYAGDELDLLSYYDDTRLSILNSAELYLLVGGSTRFDHPFVQKYLGLSKGPVLTPLPAHFLKILEKVEKEKMTHWVKIHGYVYDFTAAELEKILYFIKQSKLGLKPSCILQDLRSEKFTANCGSTVVVACAKGITCEDVLSKFRQSGDNSNSLLLVYENTKLSALPQVHLL